MNKILPFTYACLLIALVLISNSKGEALSPGEVEGVSPLDTTSIDTPIILSENLQNKVLRLYALPSPGITVLYDQWNIVLLGNVNDTYTVIINNVETHRGTLARQYGNVSYDASRISIANVTVKIGNHTYLWPVIAINHQQIGMEGVDFFQERPAYTTADLNKARLKGAGAVLLTTIITIPFVWFGVRTWRRHQGVREW